MGLFNIFTKRAKKNKEITSMQFVQSSTFRGFKKFPLVNYGHKPSEDGLKKLHSITPEFNMKGRTIQINDFVYNGNEHGVAVFVDGMQVGTYFANTGLDLSKYLRAGKISAAHVRVDTFKKMGSDAYGAILFVKLED